MSEIIYLIGAGASYGKREYDKSGNVAEFISGVPIVSELYRALDLYCGTFYPHVSFGDGHSNISHPRLYGELRWLCDICKGNATIDTYARMLSTRGRDEELSRLKRALSIFFCLIQSNEKRDMRYDSFWAAIADNCGYLPKDISILSWNYDHQVEYAMHNFEQLKTSEAHLLKYGRISCKGHITSYLDYNDSNLVKLNGAASFKASDDGYPVDPSLYTRDQFENMLANGFRGWDNSISFAWERDDSFIAKVLPVTNDTRTLVIVGYSLPQVNSEIDSRLIANMNDLTTIVIQDKNPERVKDNLLELLPENLIKKIESKELAIKKPSQVDSFFIPRRTKQ